MTIEKSLEFEDLNHWNHVTAFGFRDLGIFLRIELLDIM